MEGVERKELGVDPNTQETIVKYYVWKEGYSDKDFENIYYRGIYKENGEVKTDLTTLTILEDVSLDTQHWSDDISLYDMEFIKKTVLQAINK